MTMQAEINVKFSWSVQRFDAFPIIPGTKLLSPTFYAHESKAAEFYLRIQAGPFPSTEECVGKLYLCRWDNDGPPSITIYYEMYFPFSDKKKKDWHYFTKPLAQPMYSRESYQTYVMEITKSDMSNEQFVVICRILLYSDGRYADVSLFDHLKDLQELSKEFKELFETSLFSDAVIRTQNREFNVHRAILHARCPGLLEQCEAIQSHGAFIQYEEYPIEKLLYYIYTGIFDYDNNPDGLWFLLKKCSDFHFKHLCLPFFNEVHAHTFFKRNQISCDWIIENFFNFSEDMEFSRKIIDSDPPTLFKITIFTVQHKSNIKHLKFVMHKMCEETVRFVRCKMFVLDAAGERTIVFQRYHLFNDECRMQVTLDKEISLIRSKIYLESVMFNVQIELTDGVPVHSMKTRKESSEINRPQSIRKIYELGQDIAKLRANSAHSDIFLKIHDIRIPAHAAVLSARSPVFRRMLQQHNVQAGHTEVVMNNLDEHVALSMIEYIYSADVDGFNNDLALELCKAAKLYEIPQLKQFCYNNISVPLDEALLG